MPPSSSTMAPSLCCAFPIGEIEVQAVEDSASKDPFFTRIIMSPGNGTAADADTSTSSSSEGAMSPEARSPPSSPGPVSRYDYFAPATAPISPGGKSLADSFDSTDEIAENSNEAKLIKRVVQKRTGGMHYTMESGWLPNNLVKQSSSLSRQDSFSDTNSVNSNDVFMSIDESQEMEYLGVLDQHLMHTDPEGMSYAGIETQMDDSHPKKSQAANLEEMIEHLCAAPCGECLPDSPFGEPLPPSALRRSRYSGSIRDDSFTKTEEIDVKKRVKFQDVDIQEFKMTLGNHPSATSGPPVMLDSELFSPRQVMTLEQYEATRPPRRKRRQLKLTLQQRHNIIVKERGLAFLEVKEAWQEALEIRKQRKETLERGLALMKWDEVCESTCRKFNRLVGEPI